MARGWKLLTSLADWERYCSALRVELLLTADDVDWGAGPRAYPCLAASYRATDKKVLGCYVYAGDAIALLTAAGIIQEGAAPAAQPAPGRGEVVPQRDFEVHLSALFLTLVELLVDTRICTEEAFEARFRRRLEDAKAVWADDKVEALRGLLQRRWAAGQPGPL